MEAGAAYVTPFGYHMQLSVDSIVSVSRTTTCDIMCTSNTASQLATDDNPDPLSRTSLKAEATLPYKESSKPTLPKGNTVFTKYRHTELRIKKSAEMRKERDEFFKKLALERAQKRHREEHSATKIQSHIRGYLARPRPEKVVKIHQSRPLRVAAPHTVEARQLQDELCDYALSLGLKPIPGLTLETRAKHNRRKDRIELAASLRLQSFFRMMTCMLRTRKSAIRARKTLQNNAACTLQRFFVFVRKKIHKDKLLNQNQHFAAIKIQTRFRMFVSFHKVRALKKQRDMRRRQEDARTMIRRTLLRRILKSRLAEHQKNS